MRSSYTPKSEAKPRLEDDLQEMLEDNSGSKVVLCCCILKFNALKSNKGEKVLGCFPMKSFVKTMIVFNLLYFMAQLFQIAVVLEYQLYEIWYFYASIVVMIPGILAAFRMIDHLHNEQK